VSTLVAHGASMASCATRVDTRPPSRVDTRRASPWPLGGQGDASLLVALRRSPASLLVAGLLGMALYSETLVLAKSGDADVEAYVDAEPPPRRAKDCALICKAAT
jgi:hypothetical protein